VSPTKTPLTPVGRVRVVKNSQKVVENDRLGERSSNPVSIFIFTNSIKSYLKKTDFLLISKIFSKKNSDLDFPDKDDSPRPTSIHKNNFFA